MLRLIYSLYVCYMHQGGFLIGLPQAHWGAQCYKCPLESQAVQISCADNSQDDGQISVPPMEGV